MCGSQESCIFGSSAVAESLRCGSGRAPRPGPSSLLRRCSSESLILAPVPSPRPVHSDSPASARGPSRPAMIVGLQGLGPPGRVRWESGGLPQRCGVSGPGGLLGLGSSKAGSVPEAPGPVSEGGVCVLSWPPGCRVGGAALPAVRTPDTVPVSAPGPFLPHLGNCRPRSLGGSGSPGPGGAVAGGLGQAGAGNPVNQRTDDEGKWDPHCGSGRRRAPPTRFRIWPREAGR